MSCNSAYFNVIDLSKFNVQLVNYMFQEYKIDRWKVISLNGKILKYLISKYVIDNIPENINALKSSYKFYKYDSNISNN